MKIEPVGEIRCDLGEGPVWDPRQHLLFWVDSLAPALHRFDYASRRIDSWALPGASVGSLALRERGGLILAMGRGLFDFDTGSGRARAIAEPLAERDGMRLNDGKVDPFGAFVAGAMTVDLRVRDDCPMFRLRPNLEVEHLLDGFACFNGPCFDAAGTRLYVSGRVDGAIEIFDYEAGRPPANGRVLIDGLNPDGATVDADGYLWSAQWDDGCVLRISPDGEIDWRLALSGQVVTSVMFGGPQLDRLYVTTLGAPAFGAAPGHPDAGRTLEVTDSGFRGRPEPFFKG